MNFKEIFEKELKENNINWCVGCNLPSSHKRGFVMNNDKTTIHFDSKICTRATLFDGLHELGHCLEKETGLRRFEEEARAEEFARNKFKEYGIPAPRKRVMLGVNYVKRKKRHGDNIRRARR
jgi:Zn-dependent peptidase ImmA (M78 family)